MPLCNMEEKMPLVSVAVITYNSFKYVLDTLESIKAQTYKNIELIISDDSSTDNTMQLCKDWCDQNKDRFVRIQVIEPEKNTGVAANCNRAEAACEGDWVKLIAGDDLLLPDCIETYINYVNIHTDVVYVFAKVRIFGGDEERKKFWDTFFIYDFFNWTIEEQYDFLTLKRNCIPAGSMLYNREKSNAMGIKNDERIPLLEDWPRWINLLKHGVRFHFIDKETVLYRLSENALSTGHSQSPAYLKSYSKVYKYYCFKNDCKKGWRRKAIHKYMEGEIIIHNNSFIWRVISKLYEKLFL